MGGLGMLTRFSEKIEELFTVKQTKYTNGRLMFTFLMIFAVVAILPMYFKYEDYAYAKYKEAYQTAQAVVRQYHSEKGEYPTTGPVQWEKEKSLQEFFSEGLTHGRLYYVDAELVPELKNFKYRYIVDIDRGTLYTSQHIAYRLKRWHMGLA
ncbi:MAG: hypothetical protein KGZ81_01140 [Flavobacteriales bacterium]|nr:hypothetical protein [Flavobacteriales bacterium]